jgi:membrane protein implicated in regulation of membrane protease activity
MFIFLYKDAGIMDPFTISCIIIIAGAIFLIVESVSPGGFFVIPGVVLLVLGMIGLVAPDILMSIWAPVIALIVAAPTTIITLKGYQYLAKPEPPTTVVADSLIGRAGKVIVATEAGSMKGKVKIGSDVWSATSDDPIEEGTEVIVESSEGVHVHVRRA